MTNNQLAPESVTRFTQYGVDMIEWPDGAYVKYEDYAALAAELHERRKAEKDSEPVAYIDKQWTLVYYVPPMSMGLKIGDKLYRHAQQPVVRIGPKINGEMFNPDVIFGYEKGRKEVIENIKAAGIEVKNE